MKKRHKKKLMSMYAIVVIVLGFLFFGIIQLLILKQKNQTLPVGLILVPINYIGDQGIKIIHLFSLRNNIFSRNWVHLLSQALKSIVLAANILDILLSENYQEFGLFQITMAINTGYLLTK